MNVNRLLTTIVINLLINLPLISAITITDVSVKEIKVDSVLIEWKTDIESNSSVYYGTTTGLQLV